jgi:hypothetical protein
LRGISISKRWNKRVLNHGLNPFSKSKIFSIITNNKGAIFIIAAIHFIALEGSCFTKLKTVKRKPKKQEMGRIMENKGEIKDLLISLTLIADGISLM